MICHLVRRAGLLLLCGSIGCGTNLHTTPWVEPSPHGTVVASLGYSAGHQQLTEPPTPEQQLFRARQGRYWALNTSLGLRPKLGERVELGLSASPVAVDLKIALVRAPVAVSLLPRWNIVSITEGMNAELPLLVGWRGEFIGAFVGAGPRWMMPSKLIIPTYDSSAVRKQSELGGRASVGAILFRDELGLLMEFSHLRMLSGEAKAVWNDFSVGGTVSW